MKQFVLNFKKYGFFLKQLTVKEIKLKYRNSVLGIFWTFLEPLLTMIVLTLVFSKLLGKGTRDFPVYILSGRLVFSFFSGATQKALKSVRTHAGMIKKVYVPKYMYPVAAVFSNYIMFLISLIVLMAVACMRHIFPTIYVLYAVIPLVSILFISLGTGLILSALSVFFKDLEYLWTIVTMIVMYASAIFYDAESAVTAKNAWIFKFNPVYACIDNFRSAIFGTVPNIWGIVYSAVFAAISCIAGVVIFVKTQDKFILYL